MMKADESCPPDMVKDNYAKEVMSASLEDKNLLPLINPS